MSCPTSPYCDLTLNISPGLAYGPGDFLMFYCDDCNYINGKVLSYNFSTGEIVISPTVFVGAGECCNWTVNLSGAPGVNGTSGTAGSNGTSGSSGTSATSGTDGSGGTSGTSGSSGTDGSNGTSGSSGTDGTGGSSGSSGSSGTDGSGGSSGTSGSSGTTGTSGTSGTGGTSGADGISGVNGTSGSSGVNGTSGINGTSGVSGTSGTSATATSISRLYDAGGSGNYVMYSSGNELESYNAAGSIIDMYLNYSAGVNQLRGPGGNIILNAGNYNSYSPTLTGGGASGTWGINITGIADRAYYLETNYVGGQQLNPQTYFNNGIGVKVAMTAVAGVWSDTLWINGYSGGDVLQMCAMHFQRNGTPRAYISVQASTATSYGSLYELWTSYNMDAPNKSGTSYYQTNTWMQLNGAYGLYCPSVNAAHFYPNNSSYGAWKIEGTRNGWGGLEFVTSSNGNVSLMIGTDSATTGFHNNSSGWQLRWGSGTLYSGRGAYGGNESIVLQEDKWINNKYFGSGGEIYTTILLDSNDSSRYVDPTSTGDSIRVSGDVVAYYSDERLKDRKGNIENALDKVLSLNGFYYTPNARAQELGYLYKEEVGVSAQEVEAILPEIIKDAPIGHGYKTLNYGKLTPLLIEAIKEQQTQIEELKQLVNQLINK